jgi:serine/threonine-protein kinase RsbW
MNTNATHATSCYKLVVPSMPESIDQVAPYLSRIAQDIPMCERTYGYILVALTEAVNNAMIHGNSLCSGKQVRVQSKYENGELMVVVEDEGAGFDPNGIPDPTSPENLCKEGGRGVFLMRQLCSKLRYRSRGRVVEMCFSLTS